jgi:hypothetical protein
MSRSRRHNARSHSYAEPHRDELHVAHGIDSDPPNIFVTCRDSRQKIWLRAGGSLSQVWISRDKSA